jgi:hypothetical protein
MIVKAQQSLRRSANLEVRTWTPHSPFTDLPTGFFVNLDGAIRILLSCVEPGKLMQLLPEDMRPRRCRHHSPASEWAAK